MQVQVLPSAPFTMKNIDLSLCTSIKNRTNFLKTCIPTWKKLSFTKCIILDWDSDIPVHEEIGHMLDDRFLIVRVENQEFYLSSMCHNFAMNFVDTEWVLRIDSDIIVNYPKLSKMIVDDDCFYIGGKCNGHGTEGTILVKKKWFDCSGGYDERQCHYGWEDIHLYSRIKETVNIDVKRFPEQSLIHIKHDDRLRLEHRNISDIQVSSDEQGSYGFMSWGMDSKKQSFPEYKLYGKV